MHEEDDFLWGLGVAGVEAAVHGRTSVALPHATPVGVPLLRRPGTGFAHRFQQGEDRGGRALQFLEQQKQVRFQ